MSDVDAVEEGTEPVAPDRSPKPTRSPEPTERTARERLQENRARRTKGGRGVVSRTGIPLAENGQVDPMAVADAIGEVKPGKTQESKDALKVLEALGAQYVMEQAAELTDELPKAVMRGTKPEKLAAGTWVLTNRGYAKVAKLGKRMVYAMAPSVAQADDEDAEPEVYGMGNRRIRVLSVFDTKPTEVDDFTI